MARAKILAAAAEIAEHDGAANLSLERVAERAGVSKGGLLYHFPNKETLIVAMIDFLMEEHDQKVEERMARGESYVGASIDLAFEKRDNANLMRGCITMVATNVDARSRVKVQRRVWLDRLLEQGIAEDRALLLHLVMDGIFVNQALDVDVMSEAESTLAKRAIEAILSPSERECLAGLFRYALETIDDAVIAPASATNADEHPN